jgi:hypothetical protein
LEEDTTAALEWADYQSLHCSGCGHLRSESMDPDNAGAYEAVPLTCFACAAKDRETREAGEARSSGRYGKGALDGVFIAVHRR